MAAVLKLAEQVAKAAADHAAGGAAPEQATQAAVEQAAEAAIEQAAKPAGAAGIRGAGRGAGALLLAAKMLGSLVGQQAEDRHRDRRHPAAAAVRGGRAARAVLHSVQDIEQAHGSLLVNCPLT